MKKIAIFIVLFLVISVSRVISFECVDRNFSGLSIDDLIKIEKECLLVQQNNANEKKTYKQAIATLNSKIVIAQVQLSQTMTQIKNLEKEITVLDGVLETVNKSMDDLSVIYLARVRESYRRSRVGPVDLIFTSSNFADYLARVKYLNIVKTKDQLILSELEKSRIDYDQRKQLKIAKQAEVEKLKDKLVAQQKTLDIQIREQKNFLADTENNEKIYQAILAKLEAEKEAIESIIAGNGSEQEVRDISPGEKIASVIPGASACSTGGHLHFEVVKSGTHQNPSGFLKPKDVVWGNDPDGPFSLTGSWDWPLEDTIRITQGYGHTSYSGRYAGDVHTGIDMINKSNYSVKAVRKGKLYRGSIACGGGTLKYVHIDHADDEYDTFYLHVNYF